MNNFQPLNFFFLWTNNCKFGSKIVMAQGKICMCECTISVELFIDLGGQHMLLYKKWPDLFHQDNLHP